MTDEERNLLMAMASMLMAIARSTAAVSEAEMANLGMAMNTVTIATTTWGSK